MTFNVRVTGYKGLRQAVQKESRQFTWQHEEYIDEPYEWTQTISVGSVATSTAPVVPDGATIVAIEIADNNQIRFEYNSVGRPGGVRGAGIQSPRLAGFVVFDWRVGTTISMIDLSAIVDSGLALTDDALANLLTTDTGGVILTAS